MVRRWHHHGDVVFWTGGLVYDTLPPSSRFLFNFFKYFVSNFLLSYLYNIFAIYFPSNSPLLKSLSSTIFNFSCLLTSVFSLSLNSATTSFTFFKSFFFSHISCFTINPFHYTKYFTIS